MPIEEIPQVLEFSCTLEGMDDIVWNIKYDPNNPIGLHVSGNCQDFHCPAELFGDVTDFLQSKGILKPIASIRTAPTPGSISGQFNSSLAPPVIEGQASAPKPIATTGSPPDPLTSFDITNIPKADSNVSVPQIVIGEGDGEIVSYGVVVNNATPASPVINRPVIRTRVNDADPQSAEKEAAAIRGSGAAGSRKAIKKRHQTGE